MVEMSLEQKIARIEELKALRGAVILSHYYTRPEVQQVADFLGDSLALSIKARDVKQEVILFAGVNFMAETAKVLSPEKIVLAPCPEAGCSLADSCKAEELKELKSKHPNHKVVSYVNTTVEVKALTDICCTSSNALHVVESIEASQPIIFTPDRNLGSYIQKITGRENILLWNGACHVHEEFSLERILELKTAHPQAKIVVHPECKPYIVEVADFVGSTAAILKYCATDTLTEFIVVTEAGIITQMKKQYPTKTFIAAPPLDSTCGCNNCNYMKMITLDNIIQTLEEMSPKIEIKKEIANAARKSIVRMIEV